MVKHLFPEFLSDELVYRKVERFWIDLWENIDRDIREGWNQPWFQPLPPSISEGNPIFSAVSPRMRRGIRIIQSAPAENGLEFVAYPDTFGGSVFDPNTIHELVISCALSDVSASVALSLIIPWVEGKVICLDACEAGFLTGENPVNGSIFADRNFVSQTGLTISTQLTEETIYPVRSAA